MNGEARARILSEARTAFAASGYDGAPLRTITKAAGVDVALVAYYFGNKEGLFREILGTACTVGDEVRAVMEEDRRRAGAEVTRLFGEILSTSNCRAVLEAIFRTVLSPNHDEDAMHVHVVEQVSSMYARAVGGPDSHPGNHLFAALFTGMFAMRHLLPVEPLASAASGTLERVLAVQAQEILDAVDDVGSHAGWGELPGTGPTSYGDIRTEALGGARTTKERILDAAGRSFARRGYHGTALRDLATEVGCNVALIPYHFGSKLGLFEAVVGQGLVGFQEIRTVMDARDPRDPESNAEAARRAARIIVDMFTVDPSATALRAVILSAASPRDEHRKMHEDLMRMVQGAFDSALGTGPFRARGHEGDALSPEEAAEIQLSFLLFGALPVGILVLRSLLKLEPLAGMPAHDVGSLFAPRLEWLLNGGLLTALRQETGSAG